MEVPITDDRIYHSFVLPRNGLRCLVVSEDPSSAAGGTSAVDDDDAGQEGKDDRDEKKELGDNDDDDQPPRTGEEEEEEGMDDNDAYAAAGGGGGGGSKCAACITVRVGQMHDPPTAPGLAHLTEHMMSMGSAKFPEEDSYEKYLSKHAGHNNAYTELETTVYYFDCKSEALRGALQRLGAMMSHPLLRQDCVSREIKAVDSEHGKNRHQDYWRWHQLSRSILGGYYCTAKKDGDAKNDDEEEANQHKQQHAIGQFGTGNCDSLLLRKQRQHHGGGNSAATCSTTASSTKSNDDGKGDNNDTEGDDKTTGERSTSGASRRSDDADEEVAAINNNATNGKEDGNSNDDIDDEETRERVAVLRQAVYDFYTEYYKADRMTLVVMGSDGEHQSVERLQSWVESYFSDIPATTSASSSKIEDTTSSTSSSSSIVPPPLKCPCLCETAGSILPVRVHTVPVRAGSWFVEIQWPICPGVLDEYRNKPSRVVSHLLGHEGPGSLLHVLRDLQWAQELVADDVSTSTHTFMIMKLHLELTKEGWENVDAIVEMVYAYLNLMQRGDEQQRAEESTTTGNAADGSTCTGDGKTGNSSGSGGGSGIPPAWVYEELKVTADTQFRFLSKMQPVETATALATTMQTVSNYPKHAVSAPFQFYDPTMNAPVMRQVLRQLNPDNMLLMVSASEYDDDTTTCDGDSHDTAATTRTTPRLDRVDPWYGTKYGFVPLESSLLERWNEALLRGPTTTRTPPHASSNGSSESNNNASYFGALALPEPNDMLATNFDLIQPDPNVFADLPKQLTEGAGIANNDIDKILERSAASSAPTTTTTTDATDDLKLLYHPRCIMDTETARIWYKPDTAFGMPKVNCILLIRTPAAYAEGPVASVLASLWAETVTEVCNSFAYAASVAGLHADITNHRGGLEIHISGYNDKAAVLLRRIVDAILELPETLEKSPELLQRVQEKLKQQCLAFLVAQPYEQAVYVVDQALETPKWSIRDRLSVLEEGDDITAEAFIAYCKRLFAPATSGRGGSRWTLEALVHGNVTAPAARDLVDIVLKAFKPRAPLSSSCQSPVRVVRLPPQTSCVYRFVGWNAEQDTNSCILNLYQFGPLKEYRDRALLLLLHQIVQEPAFYQLRTTEQLGYIVHAGIKTNGEGNNIKGLFLLVQSDSFDPGHMDDRIEAFLVSCRKTILDMPQEEFSSHCAAARQLLLEPNKNLGEETSKHWQVITNRTYRFYRLHQIARYLEAAPPREKAETASANNKGSRNTTPSITKLDVLRFWDSRMLRSSPHRRKLSVQIYGSNHKQDLLQRQLKDAVAKAVVQVQPKQKQQHDNEEQEERVIWIDDDDPAAFVRGQELFPARDATDDDALPVGEIPNYLKMDVPP